MTIARRVLAVLNPLLARLNLELVRKSKMDRLKRFAEPSFDESPLPEGAAVYLQATNTRLEDLKRRASDWPAASAPTMWTDQYAKEQIELSRFRGDNAYVWQFLDHNTEANYLLTSYYVQQIDTLGLLHVLTEDGLFGVHTFHFDGLTVSRDLLDSIVEIYFLEETLGLFQKPGLSILDIGAGYGRLAYRLVEAFPQLGHVFCADAVPESTFLSEYYLRFRGVDNRTTVAALDEVDALLAATESRWRSTSTAFRNVDSTPFDGGWTF